jgi:hypothetical protein
MSATLEISKANAQHSSDLADILEMHESKGEPFAPNKNGFVFTEPEIAAHRQA